MEEKVVRACIFAHYDKDDKVDEYVYYYLYELLTVVEKLIFVTVSNISEEDVSKLNDLNIKIIKRENIGYDFYSYKMGIKHLDLENFDELVICNDSVYGPLSSLQLIFEKMRSAEDLWGITDSLEVCRHLQSYFIVCKKHIFLSTPFQQFWESVEVLKEKDRIVEQYEVGFSKLLLNSGFQLNTYITYRVKFKDTIGFYIKKLREQPLKKLINFFMSPMRYFNAANTKNANATLMIWDKLISEYQIPFIKMSHFKIHTNRDIELKHLEKVIKETSNYPFSLIYNHLNRVCSK